MMNRARQIQLMNFGIALALLLASSLLTTPILETRAQLKLDEKKDGLDELPIMYRMLNVMGGPIQGFLVAALSSSAEESKQEGKFFLANQQYSWITALQPRFPRVWMNLSWNMSYNISVATKSADERWEWVNKGIAIIRDKAIPANAKSIDLYRELHRLYFHKIGGMTDDANQDYKGRLAQQWHRIMNAPQPGATYDQRIAFIKNFKDSYETYGSDTQKILATDPVIKTLYDELVAAGFPMGRIDEIDKLVFQYGNICIMNHIYDEVFVGKKLRPMVSRNYRSLYYPESLVNIIKKPEYTDVIKPFMTHLKTRVMREVHQLEPDFMWELMARKKDGGKEYGPLDWRHSSAHAFYWTNLGVKRGLEMKHMEGFDMQNLYRDMIHASQELRNTGRVFFDPQDITSFSTVPMLEAISTYIELKEEGRRLVKGKLIRAQKDSYLPGYENFLARSSVLAYTWGDIDLARKYFLKGKKEFEDPEARFGDEIENRYFKSLEEFVVEERITSWTNKANVESDLKGVLFVGYVKLFAEGDQEAYVKSIRDAKMLYKRYMDLQGNTTKIGHKERMGLKPLIDLRADSFKRFFVWNRSNLFQLIQVWSMIDEPIKLRTYYELQYQMREIGQRKATMTNKKVDVVKMFPPPQGWMEFTEKRYREAVENEKLDKGIRKK